MASGRWSYGTKTYVEAPAFTPTGGGLLDLAEVRDVEPGNPALRGYMFETELAEVALGTVSGFTQSSTAVMPEGDGHSYEVSADPFTVFGSAALDQGAGATEAEMRTRAERRLELGEGLAAERALWETGGILPTQATVVRGTATKTKIAVGLLAEWWGASNNGVPFFQAGLRIASDVAAQQLVEFNEEDAQVKGGAALIVGRGYYAKTTIGAVTPSADQAWLYISGKPLLYRGSVGVTSASGIASPTATTNNRVVAFASRTYVPSVDGVIGAVLVDLTL